jgi:hypothetical protein
MSFVHRLSANHEQGGEMRSIGIDIHRDFMEVAIAEGGEIRSGPRVAMDPESLELFAASLDRGDQVALEVSGNAWEVVRILRPHVGRLVAASPTDTGMRQARAKTDRLDARALARLLGSGQLETVWVPDEPTEAMRRRLQRRSQLVRSSPEDGANPIPRHLQAGREVRRRLATPRTPAQELSPHARGGERGEGAARHGRSATRLPGPL